MRAITCGVLLALAGSAPAGSAQQAPPPARPTGSLAARTMLPGGPFGVAVSREGVVYVTCTRSNLVAHATLPDTTFGMIGVGSVPTGVAFNSLGSRAYVTNQLGRSVSAMGAGRVSEVDVQANAVVRTFAVGGVVQGLVVSPDGRELYIANEASDGSREPPSGARATHRGHASARRVRPPRHHGCDRERGGLGRLCPLTAQAVVTGV